MAERVSRLARAQQWYLGAVDAIPDDGWTKPTLCEGWTAIHVVAHVTAGDQFVRGIVYDVLGQPRTGQDVPTSREERKQRFEALSTAAPADVKQAARRESEQTVAAVLEAVEKAPQIQVSMPVGTVPVSALRALRLNEYVIHGHDLTPAIGRSIPIPEWFVERALADSIGLMPRLHQRSKRQGESATFHVHRTDGEGEWTLRVSDGQAAVEPGHGKADVAMRGSAEGLYWLLMGRGKPEELGVELHGDPAKAAAFKEWFPGP